MMARGANGMRTAGAAGLLLATHVGRMSDDSVTLPFGLAESPVSLYGARQPRG